MTRILKEHGHLDLLKGLVTLEGSCSLPNSGLTAADFDNIPYMALKGDYTATSMVCQDTVNAINARRAAKQGTAKADYLKLDEMGILGVTHMMMLDKKNLKSPTSCWIGSTRIFDRLQSSGFRLRASSMMTRSLLTMIASLVLGVSAGAQWLHYPTAGVPRGPDGKPNLWRRRRERPMEDRISLESGCSRGGNAHRGLQLAIRRRRSSGTLAPFLEGRPALSAVGRRTRQAALGRPQPRRSGRLLPAGCALRILTFPPPRKILQLPGLVVILSERDVTYRQIFTDGRPHPKDPEPSPNGYSIGKWEKDALVVQTIGLRDGTWLDRIGSPMTDAASVTENFRRVSYGRLDIEVTVDDPKAYAGPWTVTLHQIIMLDTELLDYHCMDNEKDGPRLVGK